MLNETSAGAKELLSGKIRQNIVTGVPSVRFDPAKKSVTLFMPGFDKSEIKLFQDIKELCDHTDSNVVITEDAQARKHFFYGDLCSRVYEWNVENAFREALSQIYHIVSRKALDAGDDPATLAKGQTINVGGKDDASAIKKVGCCST